jgi:biopolymer transport protein ExbD
MPLKTHQDDIPSINLTPMIDIVFNLIIFFMVSARFTEMDHDVDLTLPAVADASTQSSTPKSHTVNVYRDGQVTLDAEPLTLKELTTRLTEVQRAERRASVIVRGDADGAFQNVAAVLTACQQAGISDMGISVRLGAANSGTKER